jgi:hypothetical protein
MPADVGEIYWNARPHLERLGVSLKRGGTDDKGQQLVRQSLAVAFPGTRALVRLVTHAKAHLDGLRVLRQGVEPLHCLSDVRVAIEQALLRAHPMAA